MGYEAVYLTAMAVREDRLEDLKRILELRKQVSGKATTLESFAALLRKELPHLEKVLTPDGLRSILDSEDPFISEDNYLILGTVTNGGTEAEALFLSHFLPEGEVIALSDEEEALYGYLVLGENKVEPLKGALVDSKGKIVW